YWPNCLEHPPPRSSTVRKLNGHARTIAFSYLEVHAAIALRIHYNDYHLVFGFDGQHTTAEGN
ncbi:MAG: hypothetical protein OXM03_01775, partial [Chloroflexota bacterium]|nr:hypothetical protein [Chloroflexota bacterium]